MLHVFFTQLRPGHLNVCVEDSSRRAEKIVKNLEFHVSVRFLLSSSSSPSLLLLLLSLLCSTKTYCVPPGMFLSNLTSRKRSAMFVRRWFYLHNWTSHQEAPCLSGDGSICTTERHTKKRHVCQEMVLSAQLDVTPRSAMFLRRWFYLHN